MEEIEVKRIDTTDICNLGDVLDKNGVEFHDIACDNWPGDNVGELPKASFRIAHDGGNIYLQYSVAEPTAMRRVTEVDNGRIWEDSCVEMFIIPDTATNNYYNIESNSAGHLLIGGGAERKGRTRGDESVRSLIERFASCRINGDKATWQLSLRIPRQAFFLDEVASFNGLKATANFYKCGDMTPRPHYLSYAPIDTSAPDFHRPDFFIPLSFL